MMNFDVRLASPIDEPFLWEMLYEAAHMKEAGESFEQAKCNPDLARYVANWGQPGDVGVLSLRPGDRQPVAAAWVRLMTGDNKGYGYLNDQTPELAIATHPQYRGQGAGSAALTALIKAVRLQYDAICLNVRDNNPALKLYQKFGFQEVPGSRCVNRVGGQSFNMVLHLHAVKRSV